MGKEIGGGWQGKILSVDLSSGEIGPIAPDIDLYCQYIGGVGLAARILYDRIPAGADPLGPENVLAVLTGPMTGTTFPGCGRISLCALSPLTGHWGQSSMGGYLGTAIKRAGWDGLLIGGAAETPVYLLIEDDEAQIVGASDLWGLDTYQVEALLRKRYPRSEVMCIGPAGENLVPMAAITQRPGKLAGRCGLGAVMGSKKIKAVVVRGRGQIKIARRAAFKALLARHAEILKTHDQAQLYSIYGTAGMTEGVMMVGDMPVQNWSGETWSEGARKIGGEAIVEQILVKRTGCYACTVQCKPEVSVDEGGIQVEQGPGPEYETLGSMGTMLRQGNLAGIAKANELCNRLGMDSISTGSTIAWAMEAFERGDLTVADTDGLELTWGNTDAILKTVEAIGRGKGSLGTLLAAGSQKAAEQVGRGSKEYAINVKGLDMAMHNPRVFNGLALCYAFLPHGASHMEGGFNQRGRTTSLEKWIGETIETMRMGTLANEMVVCSFTASGAPMDFVVDLLESTTGESFSGDSLRACADRDYLLRYAFNLKMGHAPADNVLPERIVDQMEQTDKRWVDEWPLVASTYYGVRGFDEEGYPTEEALRVAGLDDVIADMDLWVR